MRPHWPGRELREAREAANADGGADSAVQQAAGGSAAPAGSASGSTSGIGSASDSDSRRSGGPGGEAPAKGRRTVKDDELDGRPLASALLALAAHQADKLSPQVTPANGALHAVCALTHNACSFGCWWCSLTVAPRFQTAGACQRVLGRVAHGYLPSGALPNAGDCGETKRE